MPCFTPYFTPWFQVMFTEHWLPDEELDLIMDKYDKDKNGVIDFEEFKQIVSDATPSPTPGSVMKLPHHGVGQWN